MTNDETRTFLEALKQCKADNPDMRISEELIDDLIDDLDSESWKDA